MTQPLVRRCCCHRPERLVTNESLHLPHPGFDAFHVKQFPNSSKVWTLIVTDLSFATHGMSVDVYGPLADVGFAMHARFAVGSTAVCPASFSWQSLLGVQQDVGLCYQNSTLKVHIVLCVLLSLENAMKFFLDLSLPSGLQSATYNLTAIADLHGYTVKCNNGVDFFEHYSLLGPTKLVTVETCCLHQTFFQTRVFPCTQTSWKVHPL